MQDQPPNVRAVQGWSTSAIRALQQYGTQQYGRSSTGMHDGALQGCKALNTGKYRTLQKVRRRRPRNGCKGRGHNRHTRVARAYSLGCLRVHAVALPPRVRRLSLRSAPVGRNSGSRRNPNGWITERNLWRGELPRVARSFRSTSGKESGNLLEDARPTANLPAANLTERRGGRRRRSDPPRVENERRVKENLVE